MDWNTLSLEQAKVVLDTLKDALERFPDNMDIEKAKLNISKLELRILELTKNETFH